MRVHLRVCDITANYMWLPWKHSLECVGSRGIVGNACDHDGGVVMVKFRVVTPLDTEPPWLGKSGAMHLDSLGLSLLCMCVSVSVTCVCNARVCSHTDS